MHVTILPALRDNFIYLINDGNDAAVVDPGDAAPVLALLARTGWHLRAVLLTHGHPDHIAGAGPLRAATGCAVLGPAGAGITGLTRELRADEQVPMPGGALVVLDTPGHLPVHVAYYGAGVLFSGDALFGGGCGRVMGSTPAVLWDTLRRLRQLPAATRLYFGHEYTQDNLAFAAHLEPGNPRVAARLDAVRRQRAAGEPTAPSTLAVELATNPFLRADAAELAAAVGMTGQEALAVFTELRQRKNQW